MASIAAKQVAKDVLEALGKGERPILGKIVKKNGYSTKMALNPQEVTKTKSYQEEINPVVVALEQEREAIIKRLKVTRNKAKYRDLVDGLDKVTKNIQLLSGKETSKETMKISWE